MAVVKAISSKASIGQAIDYITKKEKTERKLISGLLCDVDTVKEQMTATKLLWGKTGGRTYKHFVISYHEGEDITPEQAHKNAIRLVKGTKAFKGHETLLATHIDRKHVHIHFIVNSVNLENGYKLQWSKSDLQDLKKRCNELSLEQGLHIAEKGKTFEGAEREETVSYNKDTYNLLKKAEKGEIQSYIQDIALKVLEVKSKAKNKQEFIDLMKTEGIGVDWQDNHKYITFTDLEREFQGEKKCKIRNNKLEKYYNMDFGKESLENEFERNLRIQEGTERARELLKDNRGTEQDDRGSENKKPEELGILEQGIKRYDGNIGQNSDTIRGTDEGQQAKKKNDIFSERETSQMGSIIEELERRKQQSEFRKSEIDRAESEINSIYQREHELRYSQENGVTEDTPEPIVSVDEEVKNDSLIETYDEPAPEPEEEFSEEEMFWLRGRGR